MRRSRILIPIEMLANALSKHGRTETNLLAVYIFLQLYTDGHFYDNYMLKLQAARETSLSIATVRAKFKELEERDWIGHNREKGIHHVRSRHHIKRKEGYTQKRGVIFNYQTLKRIHDLPLSIMYLFASLSVISAFIRSRIALQKELEKRTLFKPVALQGTTVQSLNKLHSSPYYPYTACSISLLSKIMNTSSMSVIKMKKELQHYGLLKVKKDIWFLNRQTHDSKLKSPLNPTGELRKGRMKYPALVEGIKGQVIQTSLGLIFQGPDQITTKFKTTRWRLNIYK